MKPLNEHQTFVLDFFKYKKDGTFLNIGAYDGIVYDNTLALQFDYNWSGICVEPNPHVFEQLKKNRQSNTVLCLNRGIHQHDSCLEFWKIEGYSEMLSGFPQSYCPVHMARVHREIAERNQKLEKIMIPTVDITTLCLENNLTQIDYVSIDVEGAELDILKGCDFTKIDIKLISLENNYGIKNEVDAILIPNGYSFLKQIGLDLFYAK